MKKAAKCLAGTAIVMLLSITVGAQSNRTDSLKSLLRTSLPDSVRIKILGDITWYYAGTRDKLDTAAMYADSIREIGLSKNIERAVIQSEFYYGTIARHRGNHREALEHFEKFTDYYEQKGDDRRLAAGLYQVGVVQKNMGNLDKSLEALMRVLTIHEANDYQFGIGFTSNSIGSIQREVKNYEGAIESYHRAIQIFTENDIPSELAMSLENLGNVYAELNEYDSALSYYNRALTIDTGLNKKFGIASELENIGSLYRKMGDLPTALEYQLKSLEIRKQLPQQRELATGMNRLGDIYLGLNRLDEAEEQFVTSLEISETLPSLSEMSYSYDRLADLNEKRRNYESANAYRKKLLAVRDSILNTERLKQINELEARYETAKKDQEIELLSARNQMAELEISKAETARNYLISVVALVLIIGLIIVIMQRQRIRNQQVLQKKNEEIRTADFNRKLTDLELKALRSQMNPHFIFNCLNSINRMILEGDDDNASRYLGKFSRLMRLTLENSENNTVTLEKELEMIEAYIQLESIRFKDKIDYSLTVDEEIDQASTLLPSMVLQPFIENSIWHGIMNKKEPGHIRIEITEENDLLKCMIEDDGVGREMALELKNQSESRTSSFGLKITEERLKLFGKQKLQEWIQFIDLKDNLNQSCGTRVLVNIPIH